MAADWAETRTILQELEQLFNREDDLKDIADIKKMEKEIELHMQTQVQEAKEIIKGEALPSAHCLERAIFN